MHEHRIRINLFNISVRYDITVTPRQEYLCRGRPRVPDSERHSGTESGCESLSLEKAIFTIGVQFGDRDRLVARDPLKLLCQIHNVCERKASYLSRGFRIG